MDYRAALVDFYRKHNPLKLVEVDALLRKYRGREEELLHALRVKYKVNEQGQETEPAKPSTPPPPPPKPSEPPPPPPREEPPQPRMEGIRNEPRYEPPAQETEEEEEKPVPPKQRNTEVTRSVNNYSGDYKGRTAAERAEYWKKELERRESEREGRKETEKENRRREEKVIERKVKPKPERMKVVREEVKEKEDEGDGEERKPRNTKLIIAIVAIVLLAAAVTAALLNKDIRHTIGTKLGISKEETPAAEAKKEGLQPGALTSPKDSTNKTGEFALEEDETEEKAPSVEDAMSDQPSSKVKSPPVTKRDEPQESDSTPEQANKPVRKKFYIGCAAVASEEMAKDRVVELKRKGFDNAGYFFIPDYVPGGKELYRIYIGPYNTLDEAEESAVNVRSETPSAYAFELK